MTNTSTEFDWSVRNPEVIVHCQPAIGIYTNTADQVVLIREKDWNEEEDAFVLISREHGIKVAHAILEAAGHGDIEFVRPCGGGYEDVPIQPAVAAITAARPASTGRWSTNRDRDRDMNRDTVTVTNGHALPLLEYKELAG